MSRHPLALSLLALGTMSAAAAPALACRANPPPTVRIGALHREGQVRGMLLVRVTGAGYTAPTLPRTRPWLAEAEIVRVLRGPRRAGRFRFGRSGDSAMCDDGIPPPARGDLWVVYVAVYDAGQAAVNHSYPLALARAADPVVARLLDQRGRAAP